MYEREIKRLVRLRISRDAVTADAPSGDVPDAAAGAVAALRDPTTADVVAEQIAAAVAAAWRARGRAGRRIERIDARMAALLEDIAEPQRSAVATLAGVSWLLGPTEGGS